MRLALDTNRYTDLVRGDPNVAENVASADAVFMPFITLGELRAGFLGGSRPVENEARLLDFLHRPGVSALYPDAQTTHYYGSLYHQLRQRGTPIPTNDIWIAALVLQHGLILYARDRHFDHIPQIPRL